MGVTLRYLLCIGLKKQIKVKVKSKLKVKRQKLKVRNPAAPDVISIDSSLRSE